MTKETIGRIIGASIGIAIGILFFSIGFWRTLLIVALAGAGWYLAGTSALKRLFQAIDRMRGSRE